MFWGRMLDRMEPWREMEKLRRDMNRLFNEFSPAMYAFPAINIWSDSEKAILTSEIPGVDKNELKISVLGNTLTLEGNRKPHEIKENEVYHRQERISGTFKRTVELPFEVDPDKISANYKDGILIITLSRKEEDKPKQIQIS